MTSLTIKMPEGNHMKTADKRSRTNTWRLRVEVLFTTKKKCSRNLIFISRETASPTSVIVGKKAR